MVRIECARARSESLGRSINLHSESLLHYSMLNTFMFQLQSSMSLRNRGRGLLVEVEVVSFVIVSIFTRFPGFSVFGFKLHYQTTNQALFPPICTAEGAAPLADIF